MRRLVQVDGRSIEVEISGTRDKTVELFEYTWHELIAEQSSISATPSLNGPL
jgi:hypothetical protein